ncbi:TonB-dependent receptor [Emcibacter nanhaiensis]|uniref:TonB-dependent receptor n=1 Tax=Emcibacter nanhaiensis TaxID=1505037 RepID=A0A501PHC0_9PROT|nr:TonB-dependent receptor [Emcibacter nanhaiensis]TPD59256.1 TonB-dependent receptor [Emcibacter nanhaiensis]
MKMPRQNRELVLLLSSAAFALFSQNGTAQESSSETTELVLEEVVVTSQRRSQSLQDVPIAMSVFDSNAINRTGINDVSNLAALTPGFSGFSVSSSQPLLTVRGVGSNDFTVGNDPALGVYVDDVYIGRSAGAITSLLDVNRVEVLKGPQGSLFGRNTTAGALSIVRNTPNNERALDLSASYGEFDTAELRAMGNIPINEDIYFRTAGRYYERDGYLTNLVSGNKLGKKESIALRSALRFEGDDKNFQIDFDWERNRDDSAIYRSLVFPASGGTLPNKDEVITDLADDNRANRDIYGISAHAEIDLGDYSLKSVSAFRHYKMDYLEDTDATPLALLHFGTVEKNDSYSEEIRLSSPQDNRLIWFIGVSAFYEKISATSSVKYSEEDFCLLLAGVPCQAVIGVPGFAGSDITELNFAEAEYLNLAIFGDATYSITDRLNFTAGVRYSYDDKSADINNPAPANAVIAPAALGTTTLFLQETSGTLNLDDSYGQVQPRFALDYQLSEDIQMYASATRGYKSGGFNILVPQAGAFDPETIWSYELGIKGTLWSGRINYDLAAFHYKYDDLQVQIVQAVTTTQNAASSSGDGIEFSVRARPTQNLNLNAGLAVLDATYDTFVFSSTEDYSGNRLPRAPKVTANASVDYHIPLNDADELSFHVDWSYSSKQYLLASNRAESLQKGFSLFNAEVGFSFGDARYRVTLYGRNLTNTKYINQSQIVDDLGIAIQQYAMPRNLGVRLQATY